MEARHLESALTLLRNNHYITIATICEDGLPWNTPVSATLDENLVFTWGSAISNIHSQNIERDGRAFVVLFDSHAPEGIGEGLYLIGKAQKVRQESEDITLYSFVPEKAWINDEAKNDDGLYKHDIRVELNLNDLKKGFSN